jgi:glycosyltransferase involved in cell wall biosynthesis
VIAWRTGSTPEVIQPGRNGVLVGSIEEAVAAVRGIDRLDRRRVRHDFEQRFTVARQAADYERLFQRQIETRRSPSPARLLAACSHAA